MDACCCKCVRVEVVESRVNVDILGPSTVSYNQSEYVPMQTAQYPEYEGDYEATPTEDTQTFATQAKLMTANFIVAPIPTNYGLITYDGTTIHIS